MTRPVPQDDVQHCDRRIVPMRRRAATMGGVASSPGPPSTWAPAMRARNGRASDGHLPQAVVGLKITQIAWPRSHRRASTRGEVVGLPRQPLPSQPVWQSPAGRQNGDAVEARLMALNSICGDGGSSAAYPSEERVCRGSVVWGTKSSGRAGAPAQTMRWRHLPGRRQGK